MANFIAALMAILIAGAFVLVYMNRASSEIVGAALPVAFAAFSALGLVFAFGRPPTIERTFPVVFVIQQADKYPIIVPYRPFPSLALGLFDRAVRANPHLLEDSRFADTGGGPLFHYYLQKVFVDWLASRHAWTWRVRVDRFHIGTEQEMFGSASDAGEFKTKKLSTGEVEKALPGNVFSAIPSFGPGTLALPPRTSFIVQAPHQDAQQGEVSEIRLKNWFCDVRIRARKSSWGVGLGAYTSLLGVDQVQAQKDYLEVQYIATITATFSPWLKGHPDMAAHREWVAGIVEGLTYEFDEESIWRRTTENYLLLQHTDGPTRRVSLPVGPLRSAPTKP